MTILYMRLAGCMMLLAGTSGFGYYLAARYRKRMELLLKLRQMIYLLKGQISYANATLQEAFGAVGEKNTGPVAELFCRVAYVIGENPGTPFWQIWSEAVENLPEELPLTKEDRQSLSAMAEHLGYLSREMQERSLLLYLEELDETIRVLKEHQQEKCRLYRSLGVMSGLFLVIVLL